MRRILGRTVPVIAAGAATLCSVALAAACTATNPELELSQAAPGSGQTPAATVTVTQTQTETTTLTVTATTTVVATTTVKATPTITITALPRPVQPTSKEFNQAQAMVDFGKVIADVRVLDGMSLSGPPAALQFDAMAGHFTALGAGGVPPGIDGPSYYGRLTSLQLFADAAADEATARSPQAPARYVVIRSETNVLLSIVNGALRTNLALPATPVTPPPP